MAKKDLYIQCELDHRYSGNTSYEVAWIQEHLAILNQPIKLKDFDYPVIVNKIYGNVKKTIEEIEVNRRNPLRLATDI